MGHFCRIDCIHSDEGVEVHDSTARSWKFSSMTFWAGINIYGPAISYKRRDFKSDDANFDGHFAVDFVVKPSDSDDICKPNLASHLAKKLLSYWTWTGHQSLPPHTVHFSDNEFADLGSHDKRPVAIILHGLAGGSHEAYIRECVSSLLQHSTDSRPIDWEVLVVNSRGCAGSSVSSSMLYNARSTWDVRQVVNWAKKRWPESRLYGIGFSIGANMLANYLGEEGERCHLTAAVLVSNPWNLEVAMLALQRTFLGLHGYSRVMCASMKAVYDEHISTMAQNVALDQDRIGKIKFLHEFDRQVQCPTWGYPSERAYYRDASSTDAVLSIRVPTLAIHAKDDPIICEQALPYEEIRRSEWVVMVTTDKGGHLGWYESNGGRWYAKTIARFLGQMLEVDVKSVEVLHRPDSEHSASNAPFIYLPMLRKAAYKKVDK